MPVLAIPGSTFTFKFGATPVDYTIQVRSLSVGAAANVNDEFTLGGPTGPANQTPVATAVAHSIDLDMLYDGDTGAYEALWTAQSTLTPIAVTIAQGTTGTKWTGAASIVENLDLTADAQQTASFTCTLRGPLVASVQP